MIGENIMLERFKGNILFKKLLKRPDINKAYAMVPETDSWYETIKTVHESLDKIKRLPHEVIEITSHDNLKLKAIYYPNNSNITVICVHGYTSHAEREWAFPGLFYLSCGYNVLICYQRAHGLSEGKYISFGALESLDMCEWVNKVNKITPNGKIIVHGLSMGGAITLYLADKSLENVKCLISDAPSENIKYFYDNAPTWIFKNNTQKISKYMIDRFKKEFKCDLLDYDVVNSVSNSKYPILLSAGSNEHLEELFEKIKKANPKETNIIILPGCNHGNGMYKQTKLYQSVIKDFINKNIN